MKEVLVVYYSQTGQLLEILENVVAPLRKGGIKISYYRIRPKEPYGFPWKKDTFFDTFPESFLQIPADFHPPEDDILNREYDLIILGYQVWYLTPSIPINSFLTSDLGKSLLRNRPVLTLLACRNMWILAQEKMKRLLVDADARLVGHIALVDRHINHVSVITISHWMLSGRKDRYLGIFPKPGISDKDIREAGKFGAPIKKALQAGNFSELQQDLLQLGAVHINPYLVLTDKRGNVLFSKWANHIIKKGGPGEPRRLKWIRIFKYYLLFAIWVIAPIVFIVFLLTYLPRYQRIKKEKIYYSSVALKESK